MLKFDLASRRRRSGQNQIALLPHNHLSARGAKYRHQANISLRIAQAIPRNPHAIGRAHVGGAKMSRELLRRKGKPLVSGAGVAALLVAVVIAIHDQLPFHGDRFILLIVKIQPSAEAARGRSACRVVDSRRPDRHHPHRRLELARFNHFAGHRGKQAAAPVVHLGQLATGRATNQDGERRPDSQVHSVISGKSNKQNYSTKRI
jgi:hypothetical protein